MKMLPLLRALAPRLKVLLRPFESVLLITYNEGLPWYIGYGRYNRWGPHGGPVAPYGNVRAELCFDAGDELARREGLRHVVVGSGLEARDQIVLLGHRRRDRLMVAGAPGTM